jgi:periplasmic divalent cation tolerance protein
MNPKIAITTVGSSDEAKKLAEALVQEKLAACVNILPAVHSVYFWEGAIQKESEALLIIKTTKAKLKSLEGYLQRNHPYSVPEFVVIDPEHAGKKYAGWVETTVRRK